MDEIYSKLKEFGKVKTNEPLSKHTTFKIGGPATYFVIVDSVDSAIDLLKYLDGEGHKYIVFGGGSNMLASDNGYDGVVVQIVDRSVEVKGEEVTATAGIQTVALAQETIKSGLTGFEWGVGIPGSIGGAIRGNAGATGAEIKDTLKSVEVYRDGEAITLSNEDCNFGYRDSKFKHNNDVILRATFSLKKGEDNDARRKALEVIKYRNETQPKGYASTGCIFKNIEIIDDSISQKLLDNFSKEDEKVASFLQNKKIPAGWLVEMCGLKGRQIGDAKISEEHGNFIINLGKATSADVTTLIEEIKQTVYDRYGFTLNEEIQLI